MYNIILDISKIVQVTKIHPFNRKINYIYLKEIISLKIIFLRGEKKIKF